MKRTISARTVCNLCFRERGEGLKEENDKHAHFTGVLENVFEDFEAESDNRKGETFSAAAYTYSIASVAEANVHANLHVEYTSEEYLNIPDISPAAQLVATTEYEVEDMKDDE